MKGNGARIGRVVAATVIVTSCAGVALGWRSRRRPGPPPITRCPLHGIAYDVELEVCPECAKARSTAAPAGREAVHWAGGEGGDR